jgi:hypothetical protein
MEVQMKLRVVPLTVLFLSLVLGAGNGAVRLQPTATTISAATGKPVASAVDAITIPGLLSYQGKLTDLGGTPVRDSGYTVTFRLFSVLTGGTAFWSEMQSVQTHAGLFNVLLGYFTPIVSLPTDGNCYLEMQVGDNTPMRPRTRIVSSGYAFVARKADTANFALNAQPSDSARIAANSYRLQGKDTTDLNNLYVNEGQANSISNPMIQHNAITSDAIEDGTIQPADLSFTPATRPLTPAVNSSELGDTAVAVANIKDGAVTNAKLAAGSVTSDKIQAGTITRSNVAPTFKAPLSDTADYSRYAPGSLDSARVSANSHRLQGKDTVALDGRYVNEGQVSSISNVMIQDNSVTSAKIPDGSVTNVKVASGIADTKISGSGTPIPNFNADELDGYHAANLPVPSHSHSLSLSGAVSGSGSVSGTVSTTLSDNSVTSATIQDGTIRPEDLAPGFRAPSSDSVCGIAASATPQPNKLYPLDASGAFSLTPTALRGAPDNPAFVILGDAVEALGIADAIKGVNDWINGVGVTGVGGAYGVKGTSSGGSGSAGVRGVATGSGVGVYGYAVNNCGVFGQGSTWGDGGTNGFSSHTSGTGVIGHGNGLQGWYYPYVGSGVAGTGATLGVAGYAANSSGDRDGGFFDSRGGGTGGYASVGAQAAGTNYRVYGSGSCAGVFETKDGPRVTFSLEGSEPLVEDLGIGQLVDGYAHVDLDPTFISCVKTDKLHPLMVFVQLNSDCRGVYVESGTTSFDVRELQGGKSSARFTYRVMGHRADTDYLRFPTAVKQVAAGRVDTPKVPDYK